MLIDRINAALLALLLVIAPCAANASQNVLASPTTGTVSGLQLTNTFNAALDSLNTANSGATAPTNQLSGAASLGNLWLNTSGAPYGLGMFDGAANWPVLGSLDPSAHAWNVQIGGGAATLASSTTVDLCATARNYITISGSVTITSFGSSCAAGVMKLVTFSGALTLTYNATSLIIPGSASVSPTAAGDQALLVSLGAGNWQVAMYTPANGSALVNPSIDLCSVLYTFATAPPSAKYLFAYGQAVSRTTYAGFLACSTITQSVSRTNGSPTLTGFSDTTQIRPGAPLEGAGLPPGATVGSTTSTTVTMASTCSGGSGACNATSSGTANVTIFPNGNGDGATTVNLPHCDGTLLAGRDNMSGSPRGTMTASYFGTSPDALGSFGGNQSAQIQPTNVPTINSSVTTNISVSAPSNYSLAGIGPGNAISPLQVSNLGGGSNWVPFAGSSSWTGIASLQTGSITISSSSTNTGGGSPTPLAVIQPTTMVNCMIRVLALRAGPQRLAANDDVHELVGDRRRAS